MLADILTEILLTFLVVFTPWAFGTTQAWSIWTFNACGYLLGLLLLARIIARRRSEQRSNWPRDPFTRKLTGALAVLTGLILLYCLVSALNARATYDGLQFTYHDCIRWLPHSYESHSTWFAFWNYLAIACVFWAVRDWILAGAIPNGGRNGESPRAQFSGRLPARLKRLLWWLCLNGALLGVEGIVQRVEGSGELLWAVKPRVNPGADSQFGPYAYRANAAQYLNMVWPICLGFWWRIYRSPGRLARGPRDLGERAFALLLPCALLMAACAIASLSRGGALVAVGELLVVAGILLGSTHGQRRMVIAGSAAACFVALGLGAYLEWGKLSQRFQDTVDNPILFGRSEIYEQAYRMALDFAVLGSGPKTFAPLYQLYFSDPDRFWVAQVHNDWLETWLTFGGIGAGLIVLALVLVFVRYFGKEGIPADWSWMSFLWLSLAGCLTHAIFDFPFQIPSLLFLFLLVASISFCFSRKRS